VSKRPPWKGNQAIIPEENKTIPEETKISNIIYTQRKEHFKELFGRYYIKRKGTLYENK